MDHVTSQDFEKKVLSSDTPVVVDFYADWCGPCKMLAPIFEDLSKEMSGVEFVKVDVESDAKLAMQYGVRGIPTVLVFKGGEPVERVTGLLPKEELKQKISAQV